MNHSIYLDHAAATPLDADVLKKMMPFLTTEFYNPSATYLAAKEVRKAVDDARARVAKTLGVRPREIIFTAGATESNNLAIHGVMAKFPGKKVLVSAIEHASVLEAVKKYNHDIIPVDKLGKIKEDSLRKLIDDDVVLVSIMYVNNETGVINHPLILSRIIKEIRVEREKSCNKTPLYFHSDAAQAPNCLPIFAKIFGLDLMSLNGGKIYGPKQSGILYIATGIELEPLIYGGGQEFGLRSGTENVAGAVGFSYALQKATDMRSSEEIRLANLQMLFMKELNLKIPSAEITSFKAPLSHNFVHIVIPGIDNERLMMELDEKGIKCAVGSACSASSFEPSHVLKAIGLSETQAQSSLRFTMGWSTTEEDVLNTVKTLTSLLA